MTTGVQRPKPIRFTDLADPVFPAAATAIRDGLAGYGATLELAPQAMLSAAVERTGLDDFGDPAFRERLDVLCTSLREEAGL
ncbi:MAG TPA: sulfotransferase, partial [Mycobacterium sp.]|nr:sulfotransferase [Mycobacterium sp.]